MIADISTDPWPRLVAEGQAYCKALIARGAVTTEGAPHFAEFVLAEHFGLTPEALRPIVSEVAATYDMTVKIVDGVRWLTFRQVVLLVGWPLAHHPVAEAMLAYHSDFLGGVIEGRIRQPGAAIAIAEAANAVSHDFFLAMFDRRLRS